NRERGVPRYNQFRRLFRLKPAASFEELTDNPAWAAQMRDVYEGKIEDLDLMVGMYAERLPPGFAFSDTAFRVFILMASRRLKSGMRLRPRIGLVLLVLVLMAGPAYFADVAYEASRQAVSVDEHRSRDCRTPDVILGWAYDAINYPIADDARLKADNPDMADY